MFKICYVDELALLNSSNEEGTAAATDRSVVGAIPNKMKILNQTVTTSPQTGTKRSISKVKMVT